MLHISPAFRLTLKPFHCFRQQSFL
uniref:Uncharacterized protein n=1 Tax=Anguilla anguilla TaxID=7936 RepID=A0A0E9T4M4_ANGAN